MSRFTSYYLYQKYEKVGDGEWTPTYPNEYSISGDSENTMPLVIKSENDVNCGYRDPIYRWADTEDTICIYNGEYAGQYLTIESLEDNNAIYWKASNSSFTKTISASTDNGVTWTEYTSSTGGSGTTIATLNAGEKVFLKGTNAAYATTSNGWVWSSFNGNKKFNVYGNLLSLVYGNSFINKMTIEKENTFTFLFKESNVVDAGNLVMQASTLTNWCYAYMFYNCANLTVAPELPATTLVNSCYDNMFYGCTSLTAAPQLPATTLAADCYSQMFAKCTSLTTAPELPATTLANRCYDAMFMSCTSLTTAPALPSTTLAEGCYASMLEGCTSLSVAPELPATTLANYCYSRMFMGCASLRTAPTLSAETLVYQCYYRMFKDCTRLNSITCLATNKSAGSCVEYWVYNVSSSGTFTKASGTTWSRGISGIPNGWTIQNA